MSSTYPPPPGFYKLYAPDATTPPPPPPAPVVGEYVVYGERHSTVISDPPFEQSKLYLSEGEGVDLREELKRLNAETLARFVALVDATRAAPSTYARRVEEITLLLNNMHHLLNSIRPSQARSTLEHVLSEQVREKREALAKLRADAAAAEATMGNPPNDALRATVRRAIDGATREETEEKEEEEEREKAMDVDG